MSEHDDAMRAAIKMAEMSAISGGGPFGAFLVTESGAHFLNHNQVTKNNDPTAHAEVMVIREACSALGTFDLSGAVLYSSCQPCPMCLTAALWARIDTIYYAATAEQAADAGFDDSAFYEQLREGLVTVKDAYVEHFDPLEQANAPFEAWAANEERTDY